MGIISAARSTRTRAILLQRGMKTLALRVRHQNVSALAVARFLEQHPAVARVSYAGLIGNRTTHARARRLFAGFAGMLSFELRRRRRSGRALHASVELPTIAPSFGGVESLLTRPARHLARRFTPEERARIGISDALVRVSVGIEATEDLIDDLAHALEA